MIVEYEGTKYHGFQQQKNVNTVQEKIEKSINRFTGEKIMINGASRTDAGVHAMGQVVSFDSDSEYCSATFLKALNYYLPEDIAVKKVWSVSDDFDPRRDAVSKVYRYSILNSRTPSPLIRRSVTVVKDKLDLHIMNQGARLFLGKHDFSPFTCASEVKMKYTIREILKSRMDRIGDILQYTVEGKSFLRYQVRRMVGTLVKVGRGGMELDELNKVINGYEFMVTDRMPAEGLCLYKVNY